MTAQIGILNKHCIALATDSAVTITNKNNQKVYNTANKLFALSNKYPVGIMINGRGEFMGVPWESIIELYSSFLEDKSFDTLQEYCKDFIDFIQNNEILSANFAKANTLYNTLTFYITELLNRVDYLVEEYEENERTSERIVELINFEVNHLLTDLVEKLPFNEGFDEIFIKKNIKALNHNLDNIINENISVKLKRNIKTKLKKLLVSLLAKDFYTNATTGIVIAGFGNNEIFPSLYEFTFEGIYEEILKYKLVSKNTISAESTESSSTALIIPFAQKEMVSTFMEGMDPILQKEVLESIYSILLDTYPKILTENLGVSLTNEQEQQLGILSNNIFNEIVTNLERYQYENYIWPIIYTIQLMPKEELATVAETLLNLASLKKRVTMDTESVGGPIDVAIITKSDGLIWIKRKQYFKPELNYRFFNNL